MRKIALVTAIFCSASFNQGVATEPFFCVKESSYFLGYTYRTDALNWNIAGSSRGPNILSELEWSDIRSNQISFKILSTLKNGLYFRGEANYGCIFHGKNRDSDFYKNDRRGEFSRSFSDAGRGDVWDLSAGFGYRFSWCKERFSLVPLAGVSWYEQHLHMFNGVQHIPDTGPFTGLHSTYKAVWDGPWIGADLLGKVNTRYSLFATLEYHFAHYRGRGHWNLREEFLSDLQHKANARGWRALGGVSYLLSDNLSLACSVAYSDWWAKNGSHGVDVRIDESTTAFVQTRLNEVNWHSLQASLWLTCCF